MGAATVTNSTFSGNSAGPLVRAGGGIGSFSPLTVTNSTFSGNSAGGSGAGIWSGGPLTVINSTFSGNSASVGAIGQRGGGIVNDGAATTLMTVTNTVIANNTPENCGVRDGGASVPVIDGGHNIDDGTSCGFTGAGCTATTGTSSCNTNPVLDPAGLQNNGGPTQTIALQAGSPAINGGDDAVCAGPPVNNRDQRAFARPGTSHTHCSIGAFEFDGFPVTTPPPTPIPTDADGDGVPDNVDNCPHDFNPAQSDGDHNGIGDICDSGTPAPLTLSRVHLKTAPNGTISVRAKLDATEWGSLPDALANGVTVWVIGAGLSAPEVLSFPGFRCLALSASRITCVGTRGESARFSKLRKGNIFNVTLGAKSRTFLPPLTTSGVQVVLSTGGFDRRDAIASCKLPRSGKSVTCKK